jgi:hypothetical protein
VPFHPDRSSQNDLSLATLPKPVLNPVPTQNHDMGDVHENDDGGGEDGGVDAGGAERNEDNKLDDDERHSDDEKREEHKLSQPSLPVIGAAVGAAAGQRAGDSLLQKTQHQRDAAQEKNSLLHSRTLSGDGKMRLDHLHFSSRFRLSIRKKSGRVVGYRGDGVRTHQCSKRDMLGGVCLAIYILGKPL